MMLANREKAFDGYQEDAFYRKVAMEEEDI